MRKSIGLKKYTVYLFSFNIYYRNLNFINVLRDFIRFLKKTSYILIHRISL